MAVKKKKLIIISIIFVALLITVGVVAFCIAKHKAGQRYLQYEELEPTQIVLVYENIGEYVDENGTEVKVNIRAIDAEGNLYSVYVPYEGWSGIESFYEAIAQGEKISNYLKRSDMEEIYSYILHIDKNAEFERIMVEVPYIYPTPFSQSNDYGIRYRADGSMEYVKYWKEESFYEYYSLTDSAAKKVINKVGYSFRL